jgi:hypothetical protein
MILGARVLPVIAPRPILSPVMDCVPNESTTAFAAMTPDDTFVKGMLYSYDE